jgi:hypothetical protein
MKAPLFDDVREAREAFEEAQWAAHRYNDIGPLISLVELMQRQEAGGQPVPAPLPGDALIAEVHQRLQMPAPEPVGEDSQDRLHHRRAQLERVQRALEPLAQAHLVRARRLHDIRHRQQHLLDHPEWADLTRTTTGHVDRRTAAELRVMDWRNRVSQFSPVVKMLDAMLPTLREETRASDPLSSARAARRYAFLVKQLNDAGVPLLSAPPDEPSEVVPWVQRHLEELQSLLTQAEEELHTANLQADEAAHQLQQLLG